MTITEKELAEKLKEALQTEGHMTFRDGWDTVARKAAALLGVTLAPEKPEPGTWHKTSDGFPAFVAEGGVLHASAGRLDDWIFYGPDDRWPALTPARVVSEADLASAEKYREALATERDQWKAKANDWQELSEAGEQVIAELRTEQSHAVPAEPPARRWSDGGHDPEPEDTQKFVTTREARPVVLSDEEELAIIQEVRSEGGQLTAEWTARRAMRKALAKHGGTRALPGRTSVWRAINSAITTGKKTAAVMALLGGGGRGE